MSDAGFANISQILAIKMPCPGRNTTAYTVSVAPLTFKIIQGQWFLRTTAYTAIAYLSHRNSVRLSIHPSHWWISQKRCKLGLPNLHHRLPGRLVSGTVKLFHKFEGGRLERAR